jgi:hypothetical protein
MHTMNERKKEYSEDQPVEFMLGGEHRKGTVLNTAAWQNFNVLLVALDGDREQSRIINGEDIIEPAKSPVPAPPKIRPLLKQPRSFTFAEHLEPEVAARMQELTR